MKDLVDHLRAEHLDRRALLGADRPELAQALLQLRGADRLEPLLQLDDGRHRILRDEALAEAVDLVGHDLLRFLRLLQAQLAVGVGDVLQVVDVVEEGAVDVGDGRIDVARHGEIDQEEVAHAARGARALDVRALDHEMRRRRGGDDDVACGEIRLDAAELNGLAAEALRQLDCAVVRAVGDEDLLEAEFAEVFRGQLAHLACAEEEDLQALQLAEDLLRQLDGGKRHGDRVLADAGIGAHLLGHAREERVEAAALAAE